MTFARSVLILLLCVLLTGASSAQDLRSGPAPAPVFLTPQYFRQQFSIARPPTQISAARSLDEYVVDGKLTLSLDDAIRLMLLNNTEVRINELAYSQSFFGVQKAFGPFDPVLTAGFRPQRSTSPTSSTLQGASTLSDLEQPFTAGYSQLFATGTNFNVNFNTTRSANNSSFNTFNPSFFSGTTFRLTQPLLRGRGWTVNRGPIVIARRNVKQSRANFEAQLNSSLLNVINQYWALMLAQKSLAVVEDSLRLAEESYKRDKRALELGALSPLDIYRSEGTVAQRRLQLIQSQYAIKPLEDQLRRTLGADLDARVGALDIVLTEKTEMGGDLVTVDLPAALQNALSKRPELEALRQQLANDDTSVQIANNGLRPDFNVSAFYSANGLGGNQLDPITGAVVSRGGLADSLDQVGSFNFPTYGVSLDLRLPLRNRSAAADLGTALTSKKRDLYQMRQQEQAINQSVRDAVHRLEESKLAISAAATARDLAQKTLAAEQRKYELGAQTIFFVLDAQNQLLAVEQDYVQSLINYRLAIAAMDQATGDLLERNRVRVEDALR